MNTNIAAGSEAYYGFPPESASSSNAGGSCVTAGETAPQLPKDFVEHYYVRDAGKLTGVSSTRVRYTFDGQTGKLKAAEVL